MHFAQEKIEHLVQPMRVEHVSSPFEILALAQEACAEGQAIKVLFVRQCRWGDRVELDQGSLPPAMLPTQCRESGFVELAFAGGEAHVGRIGRVVAIKVVEIVVE